jgi:uncharacterized protein involved in type VI secretion and phage assembly
VNELDLLLPLPGAGAPLPGLAVGVVTNNADPERLARVKVQFPALSDTVESTWAPVVAPMAGPETGVQALPEVGDTVLVGFEQGDVNRPFVLGGFWSAAQHPPQRDNPGNAVRLIRSRSGHQIRLDDTDGAGQIQIVDSSGKNSVTIDTASNKITVTSAGPVTIAADGDLELTAKGKLALSGRDVEVSAQTTLSLDAKSRAELTTNGPLALRGATVDIN